MGKPLKTTLVVLAGLLFLLIASLFALLIFIDPNDFKPEIEAAINKNTGRTLKIEGDLDLSVFPWIGISTGKMSLSNAPGFGDSPFAVIESSDIKVKLLPLLKQKLVVKRIFLAGLDLNLTKNSQGINNWADLGPTKKQQPSPTSKQAQRQIKAPALAVFAIGGISIEKAHLVWDDQQTGKRFEINDLNLITDEFEFDQPVGVDLSFAFTSKQPALKQSMSLTTSVIASPDLNNFKVEKINLISLFKGESIPGGELATELNGEINLDLATQIVELKNIQFSSEDLHIFSELTGTGILNEPVLKGHISIEQLNPRKVVRQLDLPLPSMQDSSAFKKFSMQLDLNADKKAVALRNINMLLDDTLLTGFIEVQNLQQPHYSFNLNVNAVNIDRYLPQQASTKSVPASRPAATPAAAVATGAGLIPIDTLRKLEAQGQLTIDQLHFRKMGMSGVKIKLFSHQGVLNTEQTIRDLYRGHYSGSMAINVTGKQPHLALNEKITRIQIEPLLKDRNSKIKMSGTASGSAVLQARGNTTAKIKSSLGGQIDFVFKDGIIKGFNLRKIIKDAISLIKGKPLPPANKDDQTAFSIIGASIKLNKGIARNKDLLAKAPELRVTGEGTANLVTESLDYTIKGTLIKKAATATEPEKIEGIPVYINIGGTFSEPVYTPDVIAMLKDKSNPAIEKKKQKLLDKVDKKFGPEVKGLLKKFF